MRRYVAALLVLGLVAVVPVHLSWASPAQRWPVCGTWREVPVPGDAEYPGGYGNVRAVDVVSPTEAWLVSDFGYEVFNEGHVYRWDGRRWSEVPFPDPNRHPDDLYWVLDDIEMLSPDEGWVVGSRITYGTGVERPIVGRWDGSRWRLAPIGIPGLRGDLNGLAQVPGTDDLIAVGGRPAEPLGATMILRWNGNAWHRMRTPAPGRWSRLSDVVAAGRVMWAVGTARRPGEPSRMLALRLTERGWATRWGPRGSVDEASAVSPDDIWAVGSTAGGGSLIRWNGRAWRLVRRIDRVDGFLGVVAFAGGNVWAVGSSYFRPWNASRGFIVHGDGRRFDIDWAGDMPGYVSAIGGTPNNLWSFLSYPPVEYAELWRFTSLHRC